MTEVLTASLARIADFDVSPYDVDIIEQSRWATGDYVVGEVSGVPGELYHIESCSGEMVNVQPGTSVIGALGDRSGTLEGVGGWSDIVDGKMHAMTSAGLFGTFTSISKLLPPPMTLDYRGHIIRNGRKVCMYDFALQTDTDGFSVPTLLLFGTSMSAGKTTTGKLACKILSSAGLNIVGAKLTGAGRYRDIVAFKNAGAAQVFDFVDVGLPSTIVPEREFRTAIRPLLHRIDLCGADFLVAEAGASPLEPYNGAAAIDELGANICCAILCASDPYAVVGVQNAFGLKPDLVTGPATATTAAIELVMKLTEVPGINIIDPDAEPAFRDFLAAKLDVQLAPS